MVMDKMEAGLITETYRTIESLTKTQVGYHIIIIIIITSIICLPFAI